MASSSYYAEKIKEFETAKGQVASVKASIVGVRSAVDACVVHTNELIICGETIDKGLLSKNVPSELSSIDGNLSDIIAECNQKIAEYTALYQQALAEEERQRQLASKGVDA